MKYIDGGFFNRPPVRSSTVEKEYYEVWKHPERYEYRAFHGTDEKLSFDSKSHLIEDGFILVHTSSFSEEGLESREIHNSLNHACVGLVGKAFDVKTFESLFRSQLEERQRRRRSSI